MVELAEPEPDGAIIVDPGCSSTVRRSERYPPRWCQARSGCDVRSAPAEERNLGGRPLFRLDELVEVRPWRR